MLIYQGYVRPEQRRGIHFLPVQNFDIGGMFLRIVFGSNIHEEKR